MPTRDLLATADAGASQESSGRGGRTRVGVRVWQRVRGCVSEFSKLRGGVRQRPHPWVQGKTRVAQGISPSCGPRAQASLLSPPRPAGQPRGILPRRKGKSLFQVQTLSLGGRPTHAPSLKGPDTGPRTRPRPGCHWTPTLGTESCDRRPGLFDFSTGSDRRERSERREGAEGEAISPPHSHQPPHT
jgi:hypothetical protein